MSKKWLAHIHSSIFMFLETKRWHKNVRRARGTGEKVATSSSFETAQSNTFSNELCVWAPTDRRQQSELRGASRPGGRLHRVSVRVGRDGDGERDVAAAAASSIPPAPPLHERGMRRRGRLLVLRRLRQRDRHVAGHLRRDGRCPARHLRRDSTPGAHLLRQAAPEEPGAWRSERARRREADPRNRLGERRFSRSKRKRPTLRFRLCDEASPRALYRSSLTSNPEPKPQTHRRTALPPSPAPTGRGPTRCSGG